MGCFINLAGPEDAAPNDRVQTAVDDRWVMLTRLEEQRDITQLHLAEIPVIVVEDSQWDEPEEETSRATGEAAHGSGSGLALLKGTLEDAYCLVRVEAKGTSATNQISTTQSQVSKRKEPGQPPAIPPAPGMEVDRIPDAIWESQSRTQNQADA